MPSLILSKEYSAEKINIQDPHQSLDPQVLPLAPTLLITIHRAPTQVVLSHQVIIHQRGIRVARTPRIHIPLAHTLHPLQIMETATKFLKKLASGFLTRRSARKTITVNLSRQ